MGVFSLALMNIMMLLVIFLVGYQFKNKYVNSAADYIIGLLVLLSIAIGDMRDEIFMPITILMAVAFSRLRILEYYKKRAWYHRAHLHARIEMLEEELSKK
ncbi:hypothetical protein [Staphylococcus rostri]|uniref:Uncharacterized protein n=1 Tax=Staphylococcus rostri TaxID=522262 RepID=A0A2K3YHX8_9STAP|nr:hypothetical protein [Staphylococcus rostri]PNZ25205.1 hypothetical protein CD122_10160 [Staphylococcus rostri]